MYLLSLVSEDEGSQQRNLSYRGEEVRMTARFLTKKAAYKDREYWFEQGYAVAVLYPGDGDIFYTVYVDLKKGRLR